MCCVGTVINSRDPVCDIECSDYLIHLFNPRQQAPLTRRINRLTDFINFHFLVDHQRAAAVRNFKAQKKSASPDFECLGFASSSAASSSSSLDYETIRCTHPIDIKLADIRKLFKRWSCGELTTFILLLL
jgi:hypothetical protein